METQLGHMREQLEALTETTNKLLERSNARDISIEEIRKMIAARPADPATEVVADLRKRLWADRGVMAALGAGILGAAQMLGPLLTWLMEHADKLLKLTSK